MHVYEQYGISITNIRTGWGTVASNSVCEYEVILRPVKKTINIPGIDIALLLAATTIYILLLTYYFSKPKKLNEYHKPDTAVNPVDN